MAGINGFTGLISNFPRGTTVPLRFDFVDADGVAIDITGSQVYVVISTSSAGTASDLELTFSPSDASGGIVTGDITDTQTLALTARTYYYSCKYVDSAGKAYTFDQGTLKIYAAVNERIAQ